MPLGALAYLTPGDTIELACSTVEHLWRSGSTTNRANSPPVIQGECITQPPKTYDHTHARTHTHKEETINCTSVAVGASYPMPQILYSMRLLTPWKSLAFYLLPLSDWKMLWPDAKAWPSSSPASLSSSSPLSINLSISINQSALYLSMAVLHAAAMIILTARSTGMMSAHPLTSPAITRNIPLPICTNDQQWQRLRIKDT